MHIQRKECITFSVSIGNRLFCGSWRFKISSANLKIFQHIITTALLVKLLGNGLGQFMFLQSVGDDWRARQRYSSAKTEYKCYFAYLQEIYVNIWLFSQWEETSRDYRSEGVRIVDILNPFYSVQGSLGGDPIILLLKGSWWSLSLHKSSPQSPCTSCP